MSNVDATVRQTDFDRWLTTELGQAGPFTALVVLVEIGGSRVTPVCSTFFHVIGDEVRWTDIVGMFAGAGRTWDGAAFFPELAEDHGPLDSRTARRRLAALQARLDADRLVLNEGHFFDRWGRRMRVEEVSLQ